MSIQSGDGVLEILDGTLKVSRLDIRDTSGLDVSINTIARNMVMLRDEIDSETVPNNGVLSSSGVARANGEMIFTGGHVYWPLKVPNAWTAMFDVQGDVSFSFSNTSAPTSSGNHGGYRLAFDAANSRFSFYYQGAEIVATRTAYTPGQLTFVKINYEYGNISVCLDDILVMTYALTHGEDAYTGEYVGFSGTSSGKVKDIKITNGDKWQYERTSNASDIVYTNGDVRVGKNLTVSGNLFVAGTTFVVDRENLSVKDKIIELGRENVDAASNVGIIMTTGGSSNVAIGHRSEDAELMIGYTSNTALDDELTPVENQNFKLRVYGNVHADHYSGDGSNIENINLSQIVLDGTTNLAVQTTSAEISVAVGDPNTGLNTEGEDELGVYTGGQERIRIDDTGNVHVRHRLLVDSENVPDNSKMIVTGSGTQFTMTRPQAGGTDSKASFKVTRWDGGAEPTYSRSKLDVSLGSGIYTNEVIPLTLQANQKVGVMNTAPEHTLSVGSNLYVADAGSDVLVVDGNVNVGNKLTVSGFRITAQAEGNEDLAAITAAGAVTGTAITLTNDTESTSPTTGALKVGTEGRVTKGGIGVTGNVHVGKGVYAATANIVDLTVGTVVSNLIVDTTSGNVGIGTTSPTAPLDVRGTSNLAAITMNGHMIPSTNAQYDLGSAEKKIRHLYLSNNSLWLGDKNKISSSDGKVKIRRRKTDVLPVTILNAGGTAAGAIASKAGATSVEDLNIEDLVAYMRTLDGQASATIDTIFRDNDDDYTTNMTADAQMDVTGPHDRPLRKYPEVALTANDNSSTSGYVVDQTNTASHGNADAYAYRLFDHSLSTAYQSEAVYSGGNPTGSTQTTTATDGSTHQGVAITLDLATKIRLSYAKITSHTYYGRTPVEGTFLGSNNNSTWDVIGTFSGLSTTAAGQTHTVHIADYATKSAYRYIRLIVTGVHPTQDSGTILEFRELEYYGYEEGSGSLDTTLKSVYNVPATTGTQLEVYYDAKDLTTMPSTVTDLSPNSNSGSVTGATLDTTDGIESFKFDASSSQNITSTIDTSYWGTNKLHSVAFWFKADRVDGKYNIFQIGNLAASEASAFWISDGSADANSGNSLNWWFYGGDSTTKVSTFSWTLNTWYHIALTFDGSTKKMYVNGHHIDFSVGNVITTPPTGIPNPASLAVGSTNAPGDYFDGSIANFRIYGAKVLNADQVKELYDYQKDYFLGSKSQVTLYKGHLGVGVTEPSGQLELAGDERIQEYPPGPMDDYETLIPGHGVFCAYASSKYTTADTFVAWKAFDKTDGTFWVSDDTDTPETYDQTTGLYTGTRRLSEESVLGEYIILKLPYSINLKSFTIEVRSTELLRGPKSGIVYGRKNNKWEVVHSFSGVTYTTAVRQNIQVINTNEYYNEFALVTTALAPNGSTYHNVNLVELRYFGTPGPTTLDKGSLSLTRSLDVPRVSRYDVDTETPRPEKLVVDFDTTVNSSPTDISGRGNHGTFYGNASYSAADKAFDIAGTPDGIHPPTTSAYIDVGGRLPFSGNQTHTFSLWFKKNNAGVAYTLVNIWKEGTNYVTGGDSSGILVLSSGKYLFWTYGGQITYTDPEGDTSYGGWRHIVAVYAGPTVADQKFYVNGVEAAIVSNNQDTFGLTQTRNLTNAKMTIGKDHYRGTYYNQANTEFSAIKVYNVALEPSEVKKLYNLGRTGRSMVISDTAVGIGKVPEAQLDVRGRTYSTRMDTQNMLVRSRNNSTWSTLATPWDGTGFTIAREEDPLDTAGSRYWQISMYSNNNLHISSDGRRTAYIVQNAGDSRLNFTGQHRCFIKDVPFTRANELEGLIVSSDQNKYIKMNNGIEKGSNAITTNESLPIVSLSKTHWDKKCFGVISASEDREFRTDQYGAFGSFFEKEKGDTRVYINSVGEGAIWVVNTNGSLEAGDYITTSNVAGYGQKQDGAGLMNYTVAKITMDCDFDPAIQPVQQILRSNVVETYYTATVNDIEEEVDSDHPDAIEHTRVTDKIENVLDEHGQIQWEDDPSGATEPAYKIRYLDADGNITDEANHVYKAAFVGCTYHCG